MKRFLTVLCVLALTLPMLAGASEAASVLRVITWAGYAPQELVDKFTAETGVEP